MVSVPVKGKVIAETTLLIPNNVKLYIRTAIDTAINIFNEILYNSYITDIRTRIVRTVYTIRDSFFSYAIHKFSKKEAAHYYDAFNYSLMRTTTIFLNSASSKEHIILKGPTWYYGGPSFEAYMGALYELMYLNSKSNDFFLDIYKGYKIITADSSDVIVKRFENLCKTRGIKLAE